MEKVIFIILLFISTPCFATVNTSSATVNARCNIPKHETGVQGLWRLNTDYHSGSHDEIAVNDLTERGTITKTAVGKFGGHTYTYSVNESNKIGNGLYKSSSVSGLGGSTHLTISCWIYPTVLPTSGDFHEIFRCGSSSGYDLFRVALNNNLFNTPANNIDVYIGNKAATTAQNNYTAANQILLNTWQYVVVTYDGTSDPATILVYINGTSRTTTRSGSITGECAQPTIALSIGCDDEMPTNIYWSFVGSICDLVVENRTWTANEVYYKYKLNPRGQ